MEIDWYAYERAAQQKGYACICGVDEAGRGPLAAPVFAAAVVLPLGLEIPGLNDSKKLSEKKRAQLYDEIRKIAISCSIAYATEQEIDELNILQATFLASILAKVSRDRLMVELDRLYPEYQFAKHKGYGTALHRELLKKYGPCPVHRRSFLKKILGDSDE